MTHKDIEAVLKCKKMDCPYRQRNYPNSCCPYLKKKKSPRPQLPPIKK